MAIEISNRALSFMLVATIVISLGGTLLSLNRLGQMGALSVTGAATTGNISLDIAVDTAYNVTNTDINFGTGAITGGNGFAILDSDYDSNTNWNGSELSQFITIQNDGNVNINLSFTSNTNESGFIGGTNPNFNFTAWDDELNSCTQALNTGENQVSNTTSNVVCESLHYGSLGNDYNDTVNISVRLYIPVDSNQTTNVTTLSFAAGLALS